MSNIVGSLQHAATKFASEIVSLLRGATLAELLALSGRSEEAAGAPQKRRGRPPKAASATAVDAAPAKKKRGRRAAAATAAAPGKVAKAPKAPKEKKAGRGKKRSGGEVTMVAERVLQYLGMHGGDVGVAGIAQALQLATSDLTLPIRKLKAEGKIKSQGEKRNTVYRIG